MLSLIPRVRNSHHTTLLRAARPFLLLSIGVSLAGCATGAAMRQGREAERRQDYDLAIVDYTQALRLQPAYAAAHNNLGVAFARQGRFADAIVQFQETLRLDPTFESARTNLDRALVAQQKYQAVDHP